MRRDLSSLTGRTFDVLVVGGGIYGLTIAYDAAQRGLSVALIERADFGSGASFNHLRTIHGGLRYLQTLDLARSRESMTERRTFATIAPQMVRPIPFVLPLERSLTRGTAAMRAAFALDRLVAFDRNQGVAPTHQLPAGRVVSGAELRHYPGLENRRGEAAVWYDYVTTEADRLTFSFAMAAVRHGAIVANYVEASALSTDGGRVVGIRARDTVDGREIEIGARVTVNATGGGVDRLLGAAASTGIPMLKAMNLVTRRESGDAAIGARTASGRHLFLVPWQGHALFGTWESASPCRPGDTGIADGDVKMFIGELNQAFPSLELSSNDVTLVHRGIVPAVATRNGFSLAGHEDVRDHAVSGAERLDGLISVVGAKYTTARRVAERVTDRLLSKLQRPAVACRTATTVLAGVQDLTSTLANASRDGGSELSSESVSHLVAAYGPGYADVLALAAGRPALKARVSDESPVIGAQLVFAARHEMVSTLADAVIRRTPLGALGHPGDLAVDRAADLVGDELGWTAERRRLEVADVRRFYAAIPAFAGTPST